MARIYKGKLIGLEHDEQVVVINWARGSVGRYPELELLHAIPNGGHRAISTARKLKAEGVRSGIPDLHLPVARQGYHSCFIEMKRADGRVKPEQREMIDRLRLHHNKVEICYSAEDAIAALEEYLNESMDSTTMDT